MAKNKFPVLATLLLVFGLAWLVNEMGWMNINLPWLPVIVIVVAVAMIVNRYNK